MIKKIIRLVKKGFQYLSKYGLLRTAKKVLKTIYFRIIFRNRKKQESILSRYVDLSRFSTVIIFENNFGWNKIMKQRPQQIAENLPADTLMFYHSHEDDDFPQKTRIQQLQSNLLLVDLGYFREALLDFLVDHCNKYLMVYSTDYIPYERICLYEEYQYKVIYEYVDDLNEELSGESYADLVARHESVLKDPNAYIVSTATKLQTKAQNESSKNIALITNGVDFDHFRYQNYDVPADMAEIRKKYHHLLCYYGALAKWFDYDLIQKLAENKEYAIILLGQDYDGTLGASGILEIDNVFFLGRKGYNELPAYGCNCDVCIIPFVLNEITESTSPVKLFEYMAMEKPIVTTALPECKKYQSVFFSESHEDFIANIAKAIDAGNSTEYKQVLVREAEANTWRSKASDIVRFVNNESDWSIRNQINDILEKETYERIVIWRSPFGWDVPLFQRPQHIARQLARQGCLVFYEVSPSTDKVRTTEFVEKNLYLVNYQNYKVKTLFEDCIAQQKLPAYIQIYSTNWSMSLEEVSDYRQKGFNLLYEYIDDISPELAGTDEIPQYIMDKYNYAMQHQEVPVVTTAKQLYNDVVEKRGAKNMVFACNGVDYDFFRDLSSPPVFEDDFCSIISNQKINVCYYGALASWFDYELIKKMAATGKYNIILIGIKYDDSFDNSEINQLENVYFIGPREYKILKYYADKTDILMIPFVINSITQATSPLKLFEYMALHKPIVTTAMQECKNYRSVLAANNHDEFLVYLEKACELRNDPAYIELLDKEAKENDWSSKAAVIIDLLKENEQGEHV